MRLTSLKLYSNQSYWLHLERYNAHTRLSLDNLPNRFELEEFRGKNEAQLINIDRGKFFLGADGDRGDRTMEDFEGILSDWFFL